MDLNNISLEKQVNLIFLSKVVKNNLALKKKTNISLFEIHRILQNQEAILKLWKQKVEIMKNTTRDTNALDALLLEWVRQCKLKKCILSGLLIHEQVKYLTELFKIPYKINKKIWTEIKTILGKDFNSKSLTACITIDIYNIFENDGKRLIDPQIYERFLDVLDVKAIKKSSRTQECKSPKKKTKAAEDRKVNEHKVNKNDDNDDVIAVENPITIVDLSNDDTEMFKSNANIKYASLSSSLFDYAEAKIKTIFSSKDFEPPDNRKRKELYIKQEPRDCIETENVHNHLQGQLNEFEEFLYITDNPTKTFKLEPDDEKTISPNIKHEPTEIDNDHLNSKVNKFKGFSEISVKQETILNTKVEDNSREIKSELDLFFMDNDDDDSECIEIYQIIEDDEDDAGEQENSSYFNKLNHQSFNGDKKKPIEIEFSDFDCLQMKLEKNCDKSLKQILKEKNNKIEKIPKDTDDEEQEEEESEETQIELEIADSNEDEQIELREIINKYDKENLGKDKSEDLLRIPEEEECKIVLEIVSDEEEDDDDDTLILSNFFKSKEFGKRSRIQTRDEIISSIFLSHSPCRKMPRLNSNESKD